MASKSKSRRRVFRASCILAALIIAGSSFAWFTSNDEVTNRLTANADYGTKIVESFAPPTNWLPAQEVNKDVYATNTGTIGAYVKETVSGALTVTNEKDTTALDTSKSLKLTEEERYAVEAGAYLAYKPDSDTTNNLGNMVVVRPADETFPRMTDFTPAGTGLYVFRRSVGVNNDATETFKYDGYYYDGTDYYKISNLTYTLESAANKAGDNTNNDGNLSSATAGFVELETNVVDPTKLEYVNLTNSTIADAAGVENNKQYLVATYNLGHENAETKLKALADAYDKAIHEREYAAAYVDAVTRELGTSSGTTATNLGLLNTAKDNYDAAIAAYDAAVRKKAATANTLANATTAETNAETARAAAETAKNAADDDVTAKEAIRDALSYAGADVEFANELTAAGFTLATVTTSQLENFKANLDPANEKHKYYAAQADVLIAQKKAADAQAALTAAESAKNAAAAAKTAAQAADSTAGTELSTAEAAKNSAYTAYTTALNNYNTALAASDADKAKLKDAQAALAAAEKALTAAATAYTNASTIPDGKDLKIWIKLSDDVVTTGGTANKWQMLPATVDTTTNEAEFYHTSILEGGETSAKLIDSVTLDKSTTQDMYKYFDFDLNVALDSVQINYADDQKTILADGTASELGASVAFTDATDINAALTWS